MDTFNLNDVVLGLREIFAQDHVDVEEVKKLLRAYKSNPKDWQKYTKFDPTRYTRNLLDGGNGKYNVIILCWSEGQGSAIHAHSNSNCFVKVLSGEIEESLFEWPDRECADGEQQPMKLRKKVIAGVDDVCYINDSIGLHRMENPSHTEPTVTLHIYIPAYQECMTFDERSGHQSKCQVIFHSRFGDAAADFAKDREENACNAGRPTIAGDSERCLD